jgi:hypothetical protein
MDALLDLQKWYASNCNGEWEEEYGVKIDTLDNPGWSVTIDLYETSLEGKQFSPYKNQISDTSWIECKIEENRFKGLGDPSKLEQILKVFIEWAKSQSEDWLQPPPPLSQEEQRKIEDEGFWKTLGEEIGPELCRHPGCSKKRIKYSVMCRQHHFEMVSKKPKS